MWPLAKGLLYIRSKRICNNKFAENNNHGEGLLDRIVAAFWQKGNDTRVAQAKQAATLPEDSRAVIPTPRLVLFFPNERQCGSLCAPILRNWFLYDAPLSGADFVYIFVVWLKIRAQRPCAVSPRQYGSLKWSKRTLSGSSPFRYANSSKLISDSRRDQSFSLVTRNILSEELGGKGGTDPRWRGDGKELFYVASDGKIMSVDISAKPVFKAAAPKPLFQLPPDELGRRQSAGRFSSWTGGLRQLKCRRGKGKSPHSVQTTG